jgi:uncharacterized protein (TIGR02145 family)
MHSIQEAINAWRQFSGTEISNWESFVASLPQNCHNPDSGILTAYQNFLKRQQYNFLFDGPGAEIITAPSITEIIQDPVELSIRNSGSELFIDYTFENWTNDNIIVLYISYPTSPGKLYQKTQTRFMGYIINYIEEIINYGRLYNQFAVLDVRNIAKSGWHVPTYSELLTLASYLGGFGISGGKLKETGLVHWNSPNEGATNEYNMSIRGCGERVYAGSFSNLNLVGQFWSSTIQSQGILASFSNANDNMFVGQYDSRGGKSVYLLKDDSTFVSTYTGNDGTIYPCVQIGTQIWTALPSIESLFADLSVITEVTDNTAWNLLSSAAWCAYNNDYSNVFSTPSLPLSLNITELYKYNFGILPEPGQSVFLRAIPMGLTNGQFFEQTFQNIIVQ